MATSRRHSRMTLEGIQRLGKNYLQGLDKNDGDYPSILSAVQTLCEENELKIHNRNRGDLYHLLQLIFNACPNDVANGKWPNEEFRNVWLVTKRNYTFVTPAPKKGIKRKATKVTKGNKEKKNKKLVQVKKEPSSSSSYQSASTASQQMLQGSDDDEDDALTYEQLESANAQNLSVSDH